MSSRVNEATGSAPCLAPLERRTVLFVAPDFPPSGYPPSIRARIFSRHLPHFGWDPIVLTLEPSYYEWDVDPENEALLPDGLDVVRTKAIPVSWARRVGVGDLGLRSVWHLWRKMSKILEERDVDLVFVSVMPFYAALLGRLAHERFGVPYVIDYQDPWVSDFWKDGAGPWQRMFSKRAAVAAAANVLEPWALRRVSHLTAVSAGTTDPIVDRNPWLTREATTEIPFGGEEAEFDYVRRHPRENAVFDRHDGLVHLSYVGRGGDDMIPSLQAIFTAVRGGLDRAPEAFERLRLHFVGTTYAADGEGRYQVLPTARTLDVEHVVTEHPSRVPYLDALQILLDSDGLIVPGSHASHYTASKIFPYILAERPLLALFHEESSVVDILRETNGGEVLTFGDADGPIARADDLVDRLEQLILDPPTACYSRDGFERYTTRAMTGRLAAAFDRSINRPAERPAPYALPNAPVRIAS